MAHRGHEHRVPACADHPERPPQKDRKTPKSVARSSTVSAPDYPIDDALDLLDFPAIRAALAAHVRYGPARPLALALASSYDPEMVATLHEETAQGRRLLDEIGDLDLTLVADPSEAVRRAALDGLLNGEELLSVADAIAVHARAASLKSPKHPVSKLGFGQAGAAAPILTAMASRIPDLTDVEQAVRRSISDRGEVLDGATPTLRGLRAHVRQAYEDVTSALGRIVRSDLSSAMQEEVISMRGDRFVLQVRSELRHRVPGIVHDASNTGATVYVEPLATVDLGNAWRELGLEEGRETARVLAQLSAQVGAAGDAFMLGSELTGAIDLIFARARYGIRTRGVTPTRPLSPAGPGLGLVAARHPALGEAAVPLSVNVGAGDGRWSVLVVTGPNTGGKTVAMKTVGLLVAMNQAGLQVPATEAVLPVFDGLYVDVGDHQSIEGSVSTFSSHMRRVIGILGRADAGSLVLLDELGASTDPEEGAALARAVLDQLAEKKIPTIVTTHHRSVAAHAEASEGMENASVDLDPDTLAPTYRLTMGIPGRSYGMSVAAGLGMPQDVLDAAGSYIDAKSAQYEESIEELRTERAAVERALVSAEATTRSAERARVELEAERAAFGARRGELVEAMHGELAAKYDELLGRLKRAEAALSWNIGNVVAADSVDRSVVESVTEDLATAKAEIAELQRKESARVEPSPVTGPVPRAVEAGAVVEVRGLGARGTVQSIDAGTGEAEVLVGSVRLRLELSRLVPTAPDSTAPDARGGSDEPPTVSASLGPALGTTELDLRGMRAEAALLEVELFLDHAIRDGMSSVRIIHGRATGVLRRVVREHLERHALVKEYAPEVPERGGDGATRVELV
jgi:DNA mismatch repair protein MutS2